MEIENMFKEARGILDEINKICTWEKDRREEVYISFVGGICNSESIEAKQATFQDIENWITAVENVSFETRGLCDKLRDLLGIGAGVVCGGSVASK